MKFSPGKLEIGTSGYTYKHWRRIFYPEDVPPGKWFEYYAEHFSTVELNVSFYRLPAKAVFAGWHRRSPRGFAFFVKGSRYITHIKRLKDCRQALRLFFQHSLALREKYAGVLWQFAPNTKKNAERLEEFLGELRRYPVKRHVFEFREESWYDREIAGLLAKAGAVYCRADRRAFYDRVEIPDDADYVYVRRHGDPLRNSYSDRALEADAAAIDAWLRHGKDVFVYFNNDGGGAALDNAETLKEILSRRRGGKRYAGAA